MTIYIYSVTVQSIAKRSSQVAFSRNTSYIYLHMVFYT